MTDVGHKISLKSTACTFILSKEKSHRFGVILGFILLSGLRSPYTFMIKKWMFHLLNTSNLE